MPRIRTLKPEHRQHRKVGVLTDRQYRLWVGMLCEADDAGRLVADAEQLRALLWAYHRAVTGPKVEAALQAVAAHGLVRLYVVEGIRYADFPSWRDHQRINRPGDSKLPSYNDSVNGHGILTERSRNIHWGSEGKGTERIGREGGESEGRKPTPESLSIKSDRTAEHPAPRGTEREQAKWLAGIRARILGEAGSSRATGGVTRLGDVLSPPPESSP